MKEEPRHSFDETKMETQKTQSSIANVEIAEFDETKKSLILSLMKRKWRMKEREKSTGVGEDAEFNFEWNYEKKKKKFDRWHHVEH